MKLCYVGMCIGLSFLPDVDSQEVGVCWNKPNTQHLSHNEFDISLSKPLLLEGPTVTMSAGTPQTEDASCNNSHVTSTVVPINHVTCSHKEVRIQLQRFGPL